MYHDNGTNQTCRHAPGSLMTVFQCIILVCILDSKCFGKAVAEIVARAGLERLSIMHQRFDRVGCLCTCKLFLVRLLSLNDRNRKNIL